MAYTPFPSFDGWGDTDLTLVDGFAERLRETKRSVSTEQLDAAMKVALRSAAVDTNAIEGLYPTDRGFTRTVATQAASWELAADEKGPGVKRAIEDAINGYEMVLDATTGTQPTITASWIRNLHAVMTDHQPTFRVFVPSIQGFQDHALPHGQYKTTPSNPTRANTGTTHDYAPPEDVAAEMARLTDELNSPAFLAAHPIMQAAYAHHAFVAIHPFADGNGRVSRALASVFTYRNPGVPLVVFADQRDSYFDALEAADWGDTAPFIGFIAERVIDTANTIERTLLPGATGASVSLAGERLRHLAQAAFIQAGRHDLVPLTIVVLPKTADRNATVTLLANGAAPFEAFLREIDPVVTRSLHDGLTAWVANAARIAPASSDLPAL